MIPQPEAAQKSFINFGAFLCTFFYSSVYGRRWVQHLLGNPRGTNTGCEALCLWKKRIFFFFSRGVNTSKASCEHGIPSVPGLKAFAGLESSLRFNPAICSSRLELRQLLLPHGNLQPADGQTAPRVNTLPRWGFWALNSRRWEQEKQGVNIL